MIILFKLILITSLLILGYTIASQENMVFYKIRVWAEKVYDKGSKWVAPFFLCIWCHSSIWSMPGFLFAYGIGVIGLSWNLLWYYPLCVCGSSLVSGLIWTLYTTVNSVKDKNDQSAIYFENINNK